MIFRRKFVKIMLLVSMAILLSAGIGIIILHYRVQNVKKETARVTREMLYSLIEVKTEQVIEDFSEHLRGKNVSERKKIIRELIFPDNPHRAKEIYESVFSMTDGSVLYSYETDTTRVKPQGPDLNREIALAKRGGGFENYSVNDEHWILYLSFIKNTPYAYAVNINAGSIITGLYHIFDPTFSLFRSISIGLFGGAVLLLLCIYLFSLPILRRVVILEKEIHEKNDKLNKLNTMLNVEVELRKTIEDELKVIAITDGLTGLANRRMFDKTLAKEWIRHMRGSHPLSLLVCDIDFFKKYNDYYGHQKGDECIAAVASALSSVCRRSGDLAVRYGGEEFAIILPETDSKGAVVVSEELLLRVRELNIEHHESSAAPQVTVSVGIDTAVPRRGTSHDVLFKNADAALYKAKKSGRNRAEINAHSNN